MTIAAASDGRMKSATEAYPVLAASANGAYDVVHGATSTATAITSGVVALVRARYPHLSAAGVIERVLLTAKKPADGQVGVNAPMGFGVVDALGAVTGQAQEVSANPLGDPVTHAKSVWGGASLQSFLKSDSSSGSSSGEASAAASSSSSSGSLVLGVGVAALVVVGGVGAWLFSRRKRA